MNIVIETYSKEIKTSLLHVWHNILIHVTNIQKHTHIQTPLTQTLENIKCFKKFLKENTLIWQLVIFQGSSNIQEVLDICK